MNSSHTDRLSAAMRGFQKFSPWGGGVHVNLTKKKNSDSVVCLFLFFAFFLVLGLFNRSQMVNFKEKYHFSRLRRGSKFSRGGGGKCLLPLETQITCDFPGDPDPLAPPLWIRTWLRSNSFPVHKMMRSPLGLHMCSFSCNFVVCFQSSPAIKSFLELTAWLLPGLSNILCNSSLQYSITQYR